MNEVISTIEEQKTKQARIAKVLGQNPRINGCMITDQHNEVINPHALTKQFKKFIITNNKNNEYILPEIRLHDLRHGFATMMLYNDVNIKIVSDMLGHARTSTTQNIYQAAASKTLQNQAVENLSNILFKKGQEKGQEKTKKA